MEVQAPFGVVTFPDGTDPHVIDQVLRQHATQLQHESMPGFESSPSVPRNQQAFNASLPPPTASGRGNPFLAAMGLAQAGPVVASQMQPGVGKALVEQVNAQNLGLGAMAPTLLTGPKALSYPLRALFAAQGAKMTGQALGERSATEDPGQRAYLATQALLGGAQTLATPGLEKPVAGAAGFLGDLAHVLRTGQEPDLYTGKPILGGPTPQLPSSSLTTPLPVVQPTPDLAGAASPVTSQTKATALPFDAPAFKQALKQVPTEQLAPQYEAIQQQSRQLLAAGRLQDASLNITKGQFVREELQSRHENQSAVPQVQQTPSQPQVAEASGLSPETQNARLHDFARDLSRVQAQAALRGQLPQFGVDVRPALQTQLSMRSRLGQLTESDFQQAQEHVQQLQQKYASSKSSTARIPRGQQGAGVDEGTSLRQQGQVAPARQGQEASQGGQVGQPEKGQAGQKGTGQGEVQAAPSSQVPGGQPTNARPNGGRDVTGGVLGQEKRNKELADLLAKRKSEGGFFRLFGGVDLSRLGLKPDAKVQGEQMYNRIRNVLGAQSSAFDYLDKAGLKQYLAAPRTMQEVEQWMTSVEPKVEVRKFGEGATLPEQREYNNLTHKLETRFPNRIFANPQNRASLLKTPEAFPELSKQDIIDIARYDELERQISNNPNRPKGPANWQSIAPKSESQMPGYVEIAVTKPTHKVGRTGTGQPIPNIEDIKFPSSHSFPPNTLGFVRGYMETDPKTGEKTFHVIEVQSDWAQRVRDYKEALKNPAGDWDAERGLKHTDDPLLPHYERLALKAAIDHAKKEGATRIAVSDAETAMMTEGHDKGHQPRRAIDTGERGDMGGALVRYEPDYTQSAQESDIPQSKGMRLHYDQTLPKILGELTGDKGQRVDFGEHKMAFEPFGGGRDMGRRRRQDLIFREPSGGLKENVTARSFDLSKTEPEKFTTFEKDKPKSPVQLVDKTRASEAGSLFPRFGVSRRATAERAASGALPQEPEPGDVMEPEEIVERGRQLLAEGVDPEKALGEALKGGYTSRDVIAVTRAKGEELAKAASATGLRYGYDSPEYKAAQKADYDWIERTKPLGTAAGESMRALQGTTSLDTGDFHSMARSYKADTGQDFTPEQSKQAQEHVKANVEATAEVMKAKTALEGILNKLLQQFHGGEAPKPESRTGETGSIFPGKNGPLDEARAAGAKRTANEAAAIWEYAKQAYLNDPKFKGTFDEMANKVAIDLGTSKKQVVEALFRPKGVKEVSDAMYRAMDKQRRVKQAAEAWLQSQKIPGWARAARMIPNLFFMDKIFLHGTVLPTTHAAVNLFHPGRVANWVRAYTQGWKMAYSSVKHEQWVQDMVNRDNFTMWKRAGLAVDPERYYEDYQNAMMKSWWSKMNVLTGKYGADSLKEMRFLFAEHIWDQAPAELKMKDGKVNREFTKQIATLVNHATGVVQGKMPEALNWTFFAPRLEASRWSWLLGDVAKAGTILAKGAKATPEERWFAMSKAKEMAWIVGTYYGLLALNQGILSASGSPQQINFTNPHRSDFMSFKAAGHNVGIIGPMLGVVRLLSSLISDSVKPQTKLQASGLESRRDAIITDVGHYVTTKLSPFAGFGLDLASQSDYRGRPLPWSQDQPPTQLRRAGVGKYGYIEYGAQQFLPIPFEEGIKEVWMSQGMDKTLADRLWLGLLSGAATATTGARVEPDLSTEPKPAPHKEPFQIKPPSFKGKKFSMGDILKRGGKQYMVTGFDTDGHPLVDEVGQEAQAA